jgi:hypothetical protein
VIGLAALVPYACIGLGYLLFRKALFGSFLGLYWRGIDPDWARVPERVWRFASRWYFAHNPQTFPDSTSWISGVGAILWLAVIATGGVLLIAGPHRRPRLYALAHAGALAFAFWLPVSWRLGGPDSSVSPHDGYLLNGFLCLLLAIALEPAGGGNAGAEAPRQAGAYKPARAVGAALLTATVCLWAFLLHGNLAAHASANALSRNIHRTVNRLADSRPAFTSYDVSNLPRMHNGVTCAWVGPCYLNFPFRRKATALFPSGAPEAVFYSVLNRDEVELVARESFLANAKVLLDSARPGPPSQSGYGVPERSSISERSSPTVKEGPGTPELAVGACKDRDVLLKPARAIHPNSRQYLYVRFRTRSNLDYYNFCTGHAFWRAGGRRWDPSAIEYQHIQFSNLSKRPPEVLFNLGQNPLYRRQPAIEELRVTWTDYYINPQTPLDIEIERAQLLEFPAGPEAAER